LYECGRPQVSATKRREPGAPTKAGPSLGSGMTNLGTTRYPFPLSRRFTVRGLKNKRVLITGGASGIGAATAARFLEEGSQVVVLDRDADGRSAIRRQLAKLACTVAADVSNLQQVRSAFQEAVQLMGAVDVLINNAGISIRHNFLEITPEEWDRTLAVNLT